MKKITINMLSSADKVAGQGVGSAYNELVNLLKSELADVFDVEINAKKDADIMHYHTIDPINLVRMHKTKGVNVAYVHFLPETLDGSIKLPKFAFNIFKKYVKTFYHTADYLVVVNPTFIADLVKFGIPREKITYIPNYVSPKAFYKKTSKEIAALKDKYQIPKDKFVVMGAGQVQTRKGVKDFIEVAKKMPDTYFVWCGGFSFGKITDGYEELDNLVKNHPENVKFLGIIPRDEMNDIYNISDVVFLPSYNELFPMVILEAVNLDKPLVLRDLDLYEDILFKKYLKGHNNSDFVNNLKSLKEDSRLYKKMQANSKEIANFYSKEHVSKLWKEFYTRIYEDLPKKKDGC